MKKIIACLLVLSVACIGAGSVLAEINFDISVFENNENYTVEFDDTNDLCVISLVSGGLDIGITNDKEWDDTFFAAYDVRIAGGFQPVVILNIVVQSPQTPRFDKVMMEIGGNRYTFTVDTSSHELKNGYWQETAQIILTDVSISLFEDIGNSDGTVKFILDGLWRDVEGFFLFNDAAVKQLYEDYVTSGSLENDFSMFNTAYPCEVQSLSDTE